MLLRSVEPDVAGFGLKITMTANAKLIGSFPGPKGEGKHPKSGKVD